MPAFNCLSPHELQCYKNPLSNPESCLLRFVTSGGEIMTSKQQRDWQELCLNVVKERDPKKQAAIVAELNRILQNQSKKAQAVRVNRVPRQRSA